MEPLISVIVPVYNTPAAYLRECVESVLGQTYEHWELILVDDGSTDGSGRVCDEYSILDCRVRTVHRRNGGLSAARNSGLDEAKGDYVTFLDSDDMLHPQAINVMLEAALTQNADIVSASFMESRECKWSELPSEKAPEVFGSEDAIAEVLYQKSMQNSVCWKLFATSIFAGLRFTEGLWYEDLDIFYRLFERAERICNIPHTLYFYRKHSGSFLSSFNRQRLDVLRVVDKMESYISENHPRILAAARDRKLSANFNMFILCSRAGLVREADSCWQVILGYRLGSLLNRRVRLKNKAGIILSFGGKRFFRLISSILSIR